MSPRRRQPSLRRDLAIRLPFVLAAGVLAAFSLLILVGEPELHYELDELSDDLAAAGRPGVEPIAPPPELQARLAAVPGLRLSVVDPATGAEVFTFNGGVGLNWLRPGPERHTTLREPGTEAGAVGFTYVGERRDAGGRVLDILASRAPASARDLYHWLYFEFASDVVPFLATLGVLAVASALVTARAMLRPLDGLAREAALVEPGGDRRLDESAAPAEVLPLAHNLNRALDRLQQALVQQKRFTADAAHELRTPLAAVQARMDGLPPGPGQVELRRSLARMGRVVDQLFTVARLEGGQVALGEAPVDLAAVAAEAVAERAPLAVRLGLELALETADGPVMVRGSAGALEGALGNLIDNALAWTAPATAVEVAVTAGGEVLVADRGPGFPGDPEAYFRPYGRGADARGADARPKPDGAGLGLAIVRDTARLHGGEAFIRERPGGGAVVGLRIPVLAPPAPGARPAGGRAGNGQVAAGHRRVAHGAT